MIEDFRRFVADDDLQRCGPVVEQFPEWSFDRSPISQFGIAAVCSILAAVFFAISFTVVVSDAPDEQLPFQQAMWGLAAAAALFGLYGLASGVWRAMFGMADVGQWWLLGERGLIIVNNGRVQRADLLANLRVKTPASMAALPQLVDVAGQSLPLPLRMEERLTSAIQAQQKRLRRDSSPGPHVRLPYALAWWGAKLFGDDRVFRLYPAGNSVLVIYAGEFVADKFGEEEGRPILTGAVGLVGAAPQAYGNWLGGREFAKRAEYLDAMSLDELREEAIYNASSAILTPENTTSLQFGPAVTPFWSNAFLQAQVKGRLAFRANRRKWELAFFTEQERDFAADALSAAFGSERLASPLPSRSA
jgi:hypothetical protein